MNTCRVRVKLSGELCGSEAQRTYSTQFKGPKPICDEHLKMLKKREGPFSNTNMRKLKERFRELT